MSARIVTIGVYGFTESECFQRLVDAHVDVFCDIRARRGLRGARYAFVNSRRLQARLAQLGIRYVHCRDLAPPQHVREKQHRADAQSHLGKRSRTSLSAEFVRAYKTSCLSGFVATDFLGSLNRDARIIALFCVERNPQVCHRSILAEQIGEDLGLEVEHLVT